ncbi:GNAT family N-acetyltransferase [Paenibacillus pinihumi]|uniref:GNAT family N-acetyltransferase n=1 Tax=Paenibacillus pinihumi TaxID=669462 RepID=UPI001FDFF8E2|nr:GNAT family protein [Paenibacillus pinihumi]
MRTKDGVSGMHFFQRDIVLENHIVKLVPFHGKYKEGLRKIIFDKEITKFTEDHILDDYALEHYIARTLADQVEKISYPFIVIDKATGEVAGSTRYGNLAFFSKRLEIGWTWYGAPYRGTDINKAAKFELLKFAFEVMGFHRVQFSVDVENIRSQRAVLKLGAKQEGVFRNNYLNARGESRDDVYYSIIHTEWPELKRTIFREFAELPAVSSH